MRILLIDFALAILAVLLTLPASPQTPSQVYTVNTGNTADAAGIDSVSMLHFSGWDRWLMFYGAVTNVDSTGLYPPAPPGCQRPIRTRTPSNQDMSEDLWSTWSATDGRTFNQCIGIAPPLLLLSSNEFMTFYRQICNPLVDPLCRAQGRANIGDPAVGIGPSGRWYMFFNTQDIDEDPRYSQHGIFLATTTSWNSTPWPVQGQPLLPGTTPYQGPNSVLALFPSVFTDPAHAGDPNRSLIVYYMKSGDGSMGGAYLHDTSSGLPLFEALPGDVLTGVGQPGAGCPFGLVDRLSVFLKGGRYYAVVDDSVYCANPPVGLQHLWLLGPSEVPWGFNWNTRRAILTVQPSTFYDVAIMWPNAIGPDHTLDGTARVYFSAKRASPDSASVGLLEITPSSVTGPGLFYPVTPCRSLDTRTSGGGTPLAAGESRTFTLASTCGIPLSAKAASANFTVVSPAAAGSISVLPANEFGSMAETLSFRAGVTRANNGIVALPPTAAGSIRVQNNSAGTTHLIIDVNGYFY